MNIAAFPENTKTAVYVDSLIRITEQRDLSERMSSRMVKCASVMNPGGFIGWQMLVPVKGRVRMSLFGTEAIGKDDLKWILGETGKVSKRACPKEADEAWSELYELYIPVAEDAGSAPSIGFGGETSSKVEECFAKWPTHYSNQFGDFLSALRETGAAWRVVIGPVSEDEQAGCVRSALRTYDVKNVRFQDYIGRPVQTRVLLRLPAAPTVRLRSIIEEAFPCAKLRRIGSMADREAGRLWGAPLPQAPVLPDFAARILMMEPVAHEPLIGFEVCEEEMKKIPAGHKNTKEKDAVVIGRAVDSTGMRRRITIGLTDLKRHYQITGQTGTGKSTLLTTMILSAIERGHGLTFFDPHGSTIDTVLRAMPEKYADRVRVVRIGDAENPVPMNIWDSDDPAAEERTINDLCDLFGDIFDPKHEGFLGPRWERWFATFAKASIAFLGRRASLESIAVLSQSQDNMLQLSKAIVGRYPELVEIIKEEYGKDRSSDFHDKLNWYLCKFQRLTSVEQLRKTLGAGANALDFSRTIDTDTVTLIDLAVPTLGSHAARIVGTLLLMKLWNAAMARQDRDRTHLVFVDEASLFMTNPMPRMLAEARKFGVAMVLCHQHAGQLTPEIREALEANSANFSAFRLSPRDAATAAVRFDDPKMAVSLARLNAFNAVTTLSVDGLQTAPFTLETDRPKRQKNGEDIARRIETRSIETLVEPYREQRALTVAEITDLLKHSDQPDQPQPSENPDWLEEYTRRRKNMKKAV